MAEKSVPITEEGYARLVAELEHLRNEKLPELTARIHELREDRSTVDETELDETRNDQALLESRIRMLESQIRNAQIIKKEDQPSSTVKVGSAVTVTGASGEEEHYRIVGSAEANPRGGLISNESPVGRALLGRRVGETVEAVVPSGVLKLKITRIE